MTKTASQLKQLLREGLYLEALELSKDASMGQIVKRVVELKGIYSGDQAMLDLLDEARQDLQGGRYPADKNLCDDFCSKLGQEFQRCIFNETVLTREKVWRGCIRQKTHPRIELSKTMSTQGTGIANDLTEKLKGIEISQARQAADKSLRALEIAQLYSDDREHLASVRAKLGGMVYCNIGIERINRAMAGLHQTNERLFQEASTYDIEPTLKRAKGAFDTAVTEIKEGISDIEKALQMDSQNTKIREQLAEGKRILSTTMQERNGVEELLKKRMAVFYCNRGIERINRAQEELKSAMEVIQSKISSGRFDVNSLMAGKLIDFRNIDPDILRQALSNPATQKTLLRFLIPDIDETRSRAINEVKAGIADIEEAKRLDPQNQHIDDQLRTARQVLENMGGRAEATPSTSQSVVRKSSVRPTTTKSSAPTSRKPVARSSKRWGVALVLALSLGWLGADRFYLGLSSAWGKLGLFLGWLIMTMIQGPGLFMWIVLAIAIWWILDIILVAGRWIKDGEGLRFR